jgi:hypothetical protein
VCTNKNNKLESQWPTWQLYIYTYTPSLNTKFKTITYTMYVIMWHWIWLTNKRIRQVICKLKGSREPLLKGHWDSNLLFLFVHTNPNLLEALWAGIIRSLSISFKAQRSWISKLHLFSWNAIQLFQGKGSREPLLNFRCRLLTYKL